MRLIKLQNGKKPQPLVGGRQMLMDFGPLLLFFCANYLSKDLIFSVKVLVLATIISLIVSWWLERRLSIMAIVGCTGLVLFSGLTIYFNNEVFIKIKPTVLTLMFAAAIVGGRLLGYNPLGALLGQQIKLNDNGWRWISRLWVAMFLCSAIANEIAWRYLSTDNWVTFKVFGLTGISLIFVILSVPLIQRHQIPDQ